MKSKKETRLRRTRLWLCEYLLIQMLWSLTNCSLDSIESMKMETVIRSPQKGVVAKLVHKEEDICKAGTVLVLFEEVV